MCRAGVINARNAADATMNRSTCHAASIGPCPPGSPQSSAGGRFPVGAQLRQLAGWSALLLLLLLGGCTEGPLGELRDIRPERHSIADPGVVGASATGRGCGHTRSEALDTARRVAQFNLRSLTGSARYSIRYNLLSETRTEEGVCMEMNALALEPRPHER